jgi:hypothetical protein
MTFLVTDMEGSMFAGVDASSRGMVGGNEVLDETIESHGGTTLSSGASVIRWRRYSGRQPLPCRRRSTRSAD